VRNIEVLAGMCNYVFEKKAPCLPKMADNEFLTLGKKCLVGWKRRFTHPVLGYLPPAELMPKYKARLEYELSVLKKMGFSGYFLLVEDLVMWSKENGIIVGPGRGSCFLPNHHVVCDKSGLTKAIQDFSVGDKVLAHDGSTQEVIATLEFDRDEEIIELEFSNGVKIECTKDHKFYTRNRGWVVAEELCDEDEFDDVSKLAEGIESASPPSA
jgi:DNA polymerase-3 subunit alpha